MNNDRFQLIAAPFTPMKADGALDLDRIAPYREFLKAQGVDGAFVCGTTGEGALLDADEREAVVDAWVAARGGDSSFRIFVHVGSECPALSVRLARHAASSGANAFAMLSPTFFKPSGEDSVIEQAAEVAAAAPKLPFYYYHIPAMTGLTLSIPKLIRLAMKQIPNFAGVKFTHADPGEYLECLALAGDKAEILFGRDELLLFGLAAGARGAVGSTYNFAAPIYRKLIAAYESGDMALARRMQIEARDLIFAIIGNGGLSAQKAAMAAVGIDCGPCRLPLPRITPEQTSTIATLLQSCSTLPQ